MSSGRGIKSGSVPSVNQRSVGFSRGDGRGVWTFEGVGVVGVFDSEILEMGLILVVVWSVGSFMEDGVRVLVLCSERGGEGVFSSDDDGNRV